MAHPKTYLLTAPSDASDAMGTGMHWRDLEKGLRQAFRERDAQFGDSRVRVDGPEVRDDKGFLVDNEE